MKRGRRPAWPVIRKRKNRSGIAYRVDAGRVNGKRVVKQFPTMEDAELFAAELRAGREAQKAAEKFERRNRAVSLANLSDDQRADVLVACKMLKDTRGTLAEAVRFWKQHSPVSGGKTCAEVLEELLKSVRMANRRPRTVQELEFKLGDFCRDFGEVSVMQVTTTDLVRWLEERTGDLSPRSRAAYRQALNRLFAYAVRMEYRESNPVSAIEKPSCDEVVPEIHTVAEVRKLLNLAWEEAPDLVPYLAIGYFAGLRTENELGRLDWRHIDFEEGVIEVTAASAKKRRARFVEMQPNLVEWLLPFRKPSGLVYYSRRQHRALFARAGIPWPRNVMRHSFASYHLAAYGDAAQTAAMLGHPNGVEVLFGYYRKLVRRKQAGTYWSVSAPKEF